MAANDTPSQDGPGTHYPEIWAALAAPWPSNEVKQRPGSGGKQLHYVTARQVMNRLDEVVGPENWRDAYLETKDGMKCLLSLRVGGEWITKEDGGGFATMGDDDDQEKSGYSSAFKRSAVKFGIGRYLYKDGMPNYVRKQLGFIPSDPIPGAHHAKNHSNQTGHGVGAFPDPDVVKQFALWIDDHCNEVNQKWLDFLTDPHGEIRKGPATIINPWQLSGHLLKWGRTAMGLNAPEEIRAGSRDKYAAVLWARDQTAVIDEATEYCRHCWRQAKSKLEPLKTHDPDADDLKAQDEILDDILTTEAGARG